MLPAVTTAPAAETAFVPSPRFQPTVAAGGANARQAPPAPPEDINALRGELGQALSRIDQLEQQVRGDERDSTEGQPDERLSNLETAFDRFEDQMTAERSARFPSAKLTGFTQLDDYMMSQSPLNKQTVGNGQNGLGFRRARVAIVGNIARLHRLHGGSRFCHRPAGPSFFDMWAEQENIPFFGSVRCGQYLQPFSVDAMSGFRHLPFLERSLPFLCFVPFRRVGVMSSVNTPDELTYLAYSMFRTGGFNGAPGRGQSLRHRYRRSGGGVVLGAVDTPLALRPHRRRPLSMARRSFVQPSAR